MRFLYNILAVLLVLAALPVFLFRLVREKGFGERLRQSFGFLDEQTIATVSNRRCIWLHAASVGEIVATSPLVKEIRRQMPEQVILISVVTASGYAMAQKIITEADGLIFFPLDLPWLSRRVLKRIHPMIFLPVETELWPNFLHAARRYRIPVMMVNGRISDKSLQRYRYLCGLLKDMLGAVQRFCMQSTVDAQYIIRLGADPRLVVVTGNTKFDQTYTMLAPDDKEKLCAETGLNSHYPVLIAGSTHKGEEELLLAAFHKIRQEFPAAKLILAPREILRTQEVMDLARGYGFQSVKRTAVERQQPYDILLLDTIGELGKVYSMGDIIYVGGSLIAHGGHNILEPAAHGKPILVGPHMFNFKDTYALFSSREACMTVYDAGEMAQKVIFLLQNDEVRQRMSEQALAIIRENQGAARNSVVHLQELLAAQ